MKWNDCDTEEENDNDHTGEEIGRTDSSDDEEDATSFNFMVDETSSVDLDTFVDDESWMLDGDEGVNTWETLPEMDIIIANEFDI